MLIDFVVGAALLGGGYWLYTHGKALTALKNEVEGLWRLRGLDRQRAQEAAAKAQEAPAAKPAKKAK